MTILFKAKPSNSSKKNIVIVSQELSLVCPFECRIEETNLKRNIQAGIS